LQELIDSSRRENAIISRQELRRVSENIFKLCKVCSEAGQHFETFV